MTEKWIPRNYSSDEKRESEKRTRYVFSVLKTRAKKIVIFQKQKNSGFKNSICDSGPSIEVEGRLTGMTFQKGKKDFDFFNIAKNSLENLLSNMHGRMGILAGHPWFFQYWTRDEAISARGLSLIGKKKEAKQILLNAIAHISEDGRIPNRIPEADLNCADGVGWTFFRLWQMFDEGDLNAKEKNFVEEKLRLSLSRMEENLMDEGLIKNNRLETWIDTDFQGDDRSGKRIEIQVLTLAMYEFLFLLGGKKEDQKKIIAMKKKIKEVFWNGKYLKDGSEDETIRPNLFFAFYLFPKLLTKKEWESCFDVALKFLWLPWGGLSTIDKNHPLFCAKHTGQNNQSYHRGDSWYFMNNIAAICFLRLGGKYISFAKKIFEASKKDLLELGVRGACSEVSSAGEQTSEGCWNQAWSNATFLELLDEVSKIPSDQVSKWGAL